MKEVRTRDPVIGKETSSLEQICSLSTLDSLDRRTRHRVPCATCQMCMIKKDRRHPLCLAGISQVMDINRLDSGDAEARGWPSDGMNRPVTGKEEALGHHGTFMATIEPYISHSIEPPLSWRRVIMDELRTISEGESVDGMLDRILSHSKEEPIPDSLIIYIRRAIGAAIRNEDALDYTTPAAEYEIESIPEVQTLFDICAAYQEQEAGGNKDRLPKEAEMWEPPSKHYQVEERFIFEQELSTTSFSGRRRGGWLRSRRKIKDLPIDGYRFIPHPDPGRGPRTTTKCFALRDHVICPIILRGGLARKNIPGLLRVSRRPEIDRELAMALAMALHPKVLRGKIWDVSNLTLLEEISAILEDQEMREDLARRIKIRRRNA